MEQQKQTVLSPKVIIGGIIQFFKMIGRNWLIMLIFTLGGLGVGIYFEIDKPQHKLFISNVTFNMNTANQQQMFGMGELAAMMGMGGNPNANLFGGENFLYLAKSKPVLEKTMLKEVKLNGKPTLFVNYYMDSSFVVNDFLKKEEFDYAHRFKTDNRDSMTVIERKLFDRVLGEISASVEITPVSEKTTIVRMSVAMTHEKMAKSFAELMLKTLEEFYQENQNKKSFDMLKVLKQRRDSIGRALQSSEGRLARVTDLNVQAVGTQGIVEQGRLTRKAGFEQGLYLEAAKAYESMRLNLAREAPLFTVVEPPQLPLDEQYYMPSRAIFGILIGLLIGFVIAAFKESFMAALKADKEASLTKN